MRRVTKENLIAQIDRLHKIKDEQGQLSMNGEYTLQAYEMLLATMDSEPVAPVAEIVSIYGDPEAFGEREIRPLVGIQQMPYGTKLYRHVQPSPEKYNIGDATMRHIFTPTGMSDTSVMPAVFDRVESVLVGTEQQVPVAPEKCPAEIRDLMASHSDALFNDDDAQEIWNACRAAMLNRK